MKLQQKKFIAYCVFSILTIIFLVILLSNIDVIKSSKKKELSYNSGVVEPYLHEGNLYRFALIDVNKSIDNIEINILEDDESLEMKVYYQGFETEEYFRIDTKRVEHREKLNVFHSQDIGEVKSFYVDLYGEFNSSPTIIINEISPDFKIMWETVILGICIFGLSICIYIKRNFWLDIYYNKDILKMLLSNDINARYAGAFFGGLWSYAQPIISIFVFWFVFQVGFKNPPVQNIPFILWFLPAYIAWMYFQDVISYSISCLREYSYLVKKIKFKVNIIPIIKVLAAFKIHLCFIVVTFIIYAVYGLKPSIKCIQLLYYSCAMIFFLLGITWLVSTLSVFVKDIAPIINIVLQLGYFSVPIFWNEEMLHPFVIKILKLNPAYYIVQGYRDSICGGKWFWEDVGYMSYYWILAIIVFCSGIWLFDGAKRHFSDLL